MSRKLLDSVIAERMVELRNLRRLHTAARERERIKDARIKELEAIVAKQQATIEKLQIQIAELQAMVFGRKKKPPTGHYTPDLPKPEPKPRTKDSFRRPLPPAHAVTAEEPVPLPETCRCGGNWAKVTEHTRYEEDIPLPEITPDYQAHLVTKYVIERGVCGKCGKVTSGKELGGQAVRLGSNIRLLICHLITVTGMSYSQVIQLISSLYGLHLTDGEIANCLAKQHQNWLAAYQKLKADTRASPIKHYDETPWKIRDADNSGYAWVMSASGSPSTIFYLATSRGAPHVKKLHGNSSGIHISDDYSLYRNLSGQQQLCWAHPFRHIRDLRRNENLSGDQLPCVIQWYEDFAAIYQDLRAYLGQPYNKARRAHQSDELWQRLQELATRPAPKTGEPDKLTRLKAQILRAGKDRWFTCLVANTPCDNNRAERDLRPLVLKRKRSFGSKTERGAKVLSTVLSICTTTWKANPNDYFQALASV